MGSGILGLAVVFWLVLHPAPGLTALVLVPFVLLVAGQLCLPQSKRAIQVWFDPRILVELAEGGTVEEPLEESMRLSGKIIQPSYFKQWHEFEIVPCRYWLLLVLGVSSLVAAGAIQRLDTRGFGFNGIGPLYFGVFFWMTCVAIAWRWFRERRALRMSGLALGSFSVATTHHPTMRHIRYQFVDHEGEYRGGSFESMFYSLSDDLTLVFYDETDPDVSIPASAMVFHRLQWKETRHCVPSAKSVGGAGSR